MKTLILALLTLSFATALAGCGSGGSQPSTTGQLPSEQSAIPVSKFVPLLIPGTLVVTVPTFDGVHTGTVTVSVQPANPATGTTGPTVTVPTFDGIHSGTMTVPVIPADPAAGTGPTVTVPTFDGHLAGTVTVPVQPPLTAEEIAALPQSSQAIY